MWFGDGKRDCPELGSMIGSDKEDTRQRTAEENEREGTEKECTQTHYLPLPSHFPFSSLTPHPPSL